jgi:uncharacterized DUF497 family protein
MSHLPLANFGGEYGRIAETDNGKNHEIFAGKPIIRDKRSLVISARDMTKRERKKYGKR